MDAWADSMNEGALYLNSDVPSRPLLILFPELDDRPNSAEESHDRVQTLSEDSLSDRFSVVASRRLAFSFPSLLPCMSYDLQRNGGAAGNFASISDEVPRNLESMGTHTHR